MAPIALENEDHVRDAAFNKVLHGKSAEEKAGLRAMLKKDPAAQKAAIDEYFKHWDNKAAEAETAEIREVCAIRISHGGSTDRSLRREKQNTQLLPDSPSPIPIPLIRLGI